MPAIAIKLDVDECGFDALTGIDGQDDPRLIHLANEARIEIGTLRAGTAAGKDSVAICIPLPDGKVLIAETTAALFLGAARAITGWQEGRRDRGEG